MDGSVIAWVAIGVVAALVEISIPHFGLIFVTVGAIAAAFAAASGLGTGLQTVVFALALAGSFFGLRQRLIGQLGGPGVPSRTAALMGREGIVTEAVDATIGSGRVNVGGEDWAARASSPIPAGTRIRVVAADGIVLEVVPQ